MSEGFMENTWNYIRAWSQENNLKLHVTLSAFVPKKSQMKCFTSIVCKLDLSSHILFHHHTMIQLNEKFYEDCFSCNTIYLLLNKVSVDNAWRGSTVGVIGEYWLRVRYWRLVWVSAINFDIISIGYWVEMKRLN